jgi:hypothetical protein
MTADGPDTAAVAALLGVDAERLTRHTDRTAEATPASVLGWGLADPGHEDTVAAWLQARREERRGRAAVPDGGSTATLSGAGDRSSPGPDPDGDTDPGTDGDTPGGPGDLEDDHDTDPGTDDRASDTRPATPELHDEDGHLVDGHGRRLYKTTEATARLHHEATAAGWRHSYDLSPYQNLRALVELVEADRRGYKRLAYRFVLGYGPGSTPQALDRLGVTA